MPKLLPLIAILATLLSASCVRYEAADSQLVGTAAISFGASGVRAGLEHLDAFLRSRGYQSEGSVGQFLADSAATLMLYQNGRGPKVHITIKRDASCASVMVTALAGTDPGPVRDLYSEVISLAMRTQGWRVERDHSCSDAA